MVYNNSDHWWADLRCDTNGDGMLGSYRYDGAHSGGTLCFTGHELTLTSNSCLISLVLYRRKS